MNAYLIDQDGEPMVWLGKTMQAALDDAWTEYKRESIENETFDDEDEARERRYYEQSILRSCSLVAEVGMVRPSLEEVEALETQVLIDNSDDD